jgi:hypothetical protein
MSVCTIIVPPLNDPSLRNEFLQMRTDSHRSPGIFQQLYLLFPFGLTWRLYDLKWRIDAIRRSIEVGRITLLT